MDSHSMSPRITRRDFIRGVVMLSSSLALGGVVTSIALPIQTEQPLAAAAKPNAPVLKAATSNVALVYCTLDLKQRGMKSLTYTLS